MHGDRQKKMQKQEKADWVYYLPKERNAEGQAEDAGVEGRWERKKGSRLSLMPDF